MKRIINLFVLVWMALYGQSYAASLSDSVVSTPAGTEFILRNELDIPANSDYLLLGSSSLNNTFNELNQTFNQQHGRNQYAPYTGKVHYYDYLNFMQESFETSYRDCKQRYRHYYSYEESARPNNVIINQGQGNTGIIINSGVSPSTVTRYGSYQAENPCTPPQYSFAVLIIDPDESGGTFRQNHTFEVDRVSSRNRGRFSTIDIEFDHKVARGIRIVTTEPVEDVRLHHLQHQSGGDGFWSALGQALTGLTNIGGYYFDIKLPEGKRYYD